MMNGIYYKIEELEKAVEQSGFETLSEKIDRILREKIKMQTLNNLHNKGFNSEYEFDKYYHDLKYAIADNLRSYNDLKECEKELSVYKRYMDICNEYKDVYDFYKNKTMYPERYYRVHECEIMLFEEAQAELEKVFGMIPSKEQFDEELSYVEEQIERIACTNGELRRELNSLETLRSNLDIIYDKEPVREAEKEPAERSKLQQKRQRSDDFDMERNMKNK